MSQISVALQELSRGRRQQDIADAIGMPRTTFTQYRLAMRRPTLDAIEQILRAFTEEEQRVLVKAYLDDETPASWFGRVKIDFKKGLSMDASKAGKKNAGADADNLAATATNTIVANMAGPLVANDKALSEALVTLMSSARENHDVRQVVIDLAAIVQ